MFQGGHFLGHIPRLCRRQLIFESIIYVCIKLHSLIRPIGRLIQTRSLLVRSERAKPACIAEIDYSTSMFIALTNILISSNLGIIQLENHYFSNLL